MTTGSRELEGRVALVTGASRNIGRALALAHDLASDRITVNCVVPGVIETLRGASSGTHPHHTAPTLLGRRGTPEEVAGVVRFLAGPGARYVTGQDWHVNGGAYLG